MFLSSVLLVIAATAVSAAGQDNHGHKQMALQDLDVAQEPQVMLKLEHEDGPPSEGVEHIDDPSNEDMEGDHQMMPGSPMESGHGHMAWIDPPDEYAELEGDRWADPEAIGRGSKLYKTNCLICHGDSGQGDGPVAQTLEHPPANLTVNYHRMPSDGDAYLYWRVSKGATVEPFKSQKSVMPAFETLLSEDERWDVLAYVHTYFHLGLYGWQANSRQ